MSFDLKFTDKYTPVLSDVTFDKKVQALVDAINILVTPHSKLQATHIGDGVIKVVKLDEDVSLPAPCLTLIGLNNLSVCTADGDLVCSTIKLDEAFHALNLLLEE